MKRGQLSIDFITAILVAVLLLQTLIEVGDSVQESNAITSIIVQEKRVASELESFLVAVKVLDVPDANFNATFQPSKFITPYSSVLKDCAITYSTSGTETLKVNYKLLAPSGSKDINYSRETAIPSNSEINLASLSSIACGGTVVVGDA